MCFQSTYMSLPFAIYVFFSSAIMVISIILCAFFFCNKIRFSCYFSLWIHHAHYISQSKHGLDHTFLDVVDFTISRHEVINLFFLKLLLNLCMLFFNFQANNMDLVDKWYYHVVLVFNCIHHAIENYRRFLLLFMRC
jgi:hypothetical protein